MARINGKKIRKIIVSTVAYLFLAVCLFTVTITVLSKRDSDGAANILGYQMRVVISDSMAASEYTDVSDYKIKDIPLRSMIFVKLMPDDPAKADDWYRSIQVGDVLTFRYVYATQVTITHRVVSITEKETGGFIIELAGDNKNSSNGQLNQVIDTSIPHNPNYVIGKVVAQSYSFGWTMTFLQQPLSIILLIILPCLVIMVSEIIKIARVLGTEKKTQTQAKLSEKEQELEELRRRLAALETMATRETAAPAPNDHQEDPQPPNEGEQGGNES